MIVDKISVVPDKNTTIGSIVHVADRGLYLAK